jgi:hypothetical protein
MMPKEPRKIYIIYYRFVLCSYKNGFTILSDTSEEVYWYTCNWIWFYWKWYKDIVWIYIEEEFEDTKGIIRIPQIEEGQTTQWTNEPSDIIKYTVYSLYIALFYPPTSFITIKFHRPQKSCTFMRRASFQTINHGTRWASGQGFRLTLDDGTAHQQPLPTKVCRLNSYCMCLSFKERVILHSRGN